MSAGALPCGARPAVGERAVVAAEFTAFGGSGGFPVGTVETAGTFELAVVPDPIYAVFDIVIPP